MTPDHVLTSRSASVGAKRIEQLIDPGGPPPRTGPGCGARARGSPGRSPSDRRRLLRDQADDRGRRRVGRGRRCRHGRGARESGGQGRGMRTVVDLPAPFGRAGRDVPGSTSTDRPSSADRRTAAAAVGLDQVVGRSAARGWAWVLPRGWGSGTGAPIVGVRLGMGRYAVPPRVFGPLPVCGRTGRGSLLRPHGRPVGMPARAPLSQVADRDRGGSPRPVCRRPGSSWMRARLRAGERCPRMSCASVETKSSSADEHAAAGTGSRPRTSGKASSASRRNWRRGSAARSAARSARSASSGRPLGGKPGHEDSRPSSA
jgi:hypothetical protein